MNPDLLKAFFIVTQHHVFFSKIYHYDDERVLMENGFKDWQRAYDFDGGFVCVQFRPPTQWTQLPESEWQKYGTKWRVRGANYSLPFSEWKFNLRHQPAHLPWPRWVNVGEVYDRTFPMLPEWSKHHIIKGEAFCPPGYARLALGSARIYQSGGYAWAYEKSSIIQSPGSCEGLAFLHDDSRSEIYAYAMLFDRARAVVYPGGNFQKFDQAQVHEVPGPMPKRGRVNLASLCPPGENMPFNMPVESL